MLRQTARLAARRRATTTRAMSTEYAFDEPANKSNWPRTANTLINVVPQGEAHVVERARQPYDVKGPGYWVGVPGLDAIAAVVDTREQTAWFRRRPSVCPGTASAWTRRRRRTCVLWMRRRRGTRRTTPRKN